MGRLMPCKQSGCANNVLDGTYCSVHLKQNSVTEYDKLRGDDPIRKLYWTARWQRFRAMLLNLNPLCQRLQPDGSACRNPSRIIHHLKSPKVAPELFLVARNCVCLCQNCHPGGEVGTPDWKENVNYSPTELPKYRIG